jgi:hypothetical protein
MVSSPFVAFVLFVVKVIYAAKKLPHNGERLQRKAVNVL